jgi:hypothetical protein
MAEWVYFVPGKRRDRRGGAAMLLDLTEVQCAELQKLLEGALGDLSSEIAGTDNAEYRQGLRDRRTALEAVLYQLDNPPRT